MSKQRDRGRILTSAALTKLQQAIRNWEQHERKCTQERIKELTGEFKEGGLDPGTISKILKGKEGVDPESIRYLLRTFGLQLKEADLVAAIAFTTQSDPNFVGREGAIADLKTLTELLPLGRHIFSLEILQRMDQCYRLCTMPMAGMRRRWTF